MRRIWRAVGVSVWLALLWPAEAAYFGYPRNLRPQVDRIAFSDPMLQPMAHTMFCLRYEQECRAPSVTFRPTKIALTEKRWMELVSVDREINRSIVPHRYPTRVLSDTWTLNPKSGDCNDYAVSKRHQLLARGWPAQALLLAVVRTPSGEGHLVLVARTRDGDLVLDNLRHTIIPWSQTRYEWLQIQSPNNPVYWLKVRHRAPDALKIDVVNAAAQARS